MPVCKVDKITKEKVKLVRKEVLRVDPKLEGMYLSENYLINRAFNYFIKGTPFQTEAEILKENIEK